jgi:hypothetical protein
MEIFPLGSTLTQPICGAVSVWAKEPKLIKRAMYLKIDFNLTLRSTKI